MRRQDKFKSVPNGLQKRNVYLAQSRDLAGVGVEVEVEDSGGVAGQFERAGQLLELACPAELHLPHLKQVTMDEPGKNN